MKKLVAPFIILICVFLALAVLLIMAGITSPTVDIASDSGFIPNGTPSLTIAAIFIAIAIGLTIALIVTCIHTNRGNTNHGNRTAICSPPKVF